MAVAECELQTANSKRTTSHLDPYKWKPGDSPNPSGRPAMPKELKLYVREFSHEAVDRLVHIMRTSDNGEHVIRAANSILNRAWGMPAQELKHSGEVGIQTLTAEEKAERLKLLIQAVAAANPDLLTGILTPQLVADNTPPTDCVDAEVVDSTASDTE